MIRLRRGGAILVWFVGLLGAIVTLLAWVAPQSRNWVEGHSWLGWTAALTLAFALSLSVSRHWRLQDTIESLTAELEDGKRVPTTRDMTVGEKVLETWRYSGPLVSFLCNFNAKTWSGRDSDLLFEFCADFRGVMFDDDAVEQSFQDLLGAASELQLWLATEGAPDASLNAHREVGEPLLYTVRAFDVFGSAADYDRMRESGVVLALTAVEKSVAFEKTARRRYL